MPDEISTPTEQPAAPKLPSRLTVEIATQVGGALARLQEIGSNKLISTELAAERRHNEQFVIATTAAYASELLACWFTIQQEYGPLVRALGPVVRRFIPPVAPAPAPREQSEAIVEKVVEQANSAAQ